MARKISKMIQKGSKRKEEIIVNAQNYAHEYEPSNIINVYDSPLWQWRRVAQWHRYINDPYENIKSGHMIT